MPARENRELPKTEGIVLIAGALHATSPESLEKLLAELSEDYDVKNCMDDKDRPYRGWYAHLKDDVLQRKVKCDHCGHLNDVLGCRVHGFTCKGCNKVIYREYLPNSTFEFAFDADQSSRTLRFLIHSYDIETQSLYLYAKPQNSRRFFSVPREKVEAVLEEYKDSYERVTNDKGHKLLKLFMPRGCGMVYRDKDGNETRLKINTHEVGRPPVPVKRNKKGEVVKDKQGYTVYDHNETNTRQFYTEVQVYKGKGSLCCL
jgi:hypothetical protein